MHRIELKLEKKHTGHTNKQQKCAQSCAKAMLIEESTEQK